MINKQAKVTREKAHPLPVGEREVWCFPVELWMARYWFAWNKQKIPDVAQQGLEKETTWKTLIFYYILHVNSLQNIHHLRLYHPKECPSSEAMKLTNTVPLLDLGTYWYGLSNQKKHFKQVLVVIHSHPHGTVFRKVAQWPQWHTELCSQSPSLHECSSQLSV